MSTSSFEVMQQVDKDVLEKENCPEWVGCFLEKTFFDKCSKHGLQKNELNRYCITCDASICKTCVTNDHQNNHTVLTIYRHVYQNVVPLIEMESHFDCQKIQPYKCNKKWVVSLTPLPHNGSGSLIEGDGACVVCKRKLTDRERFRFCSIACKVQAVTGRRGFLGLLAAAGEGTSHHRDEDNEPEGQKGSKRSRKGVPHRAPF